MTEMTIEEVTNRLLNAMVLAFADSDPDDLVPLHLFLTAISEEMGLDTPDLTGVPEWIAADELRSRMRNGFTKLAHGEKIP